VGRGRERARINGPAQPRASLIFRRALGLGAQVLLAVGAITLAVEAGGGLYWWSAGVIAAYVSWCQFGVPDKLPCINPIT
jgi:hypothetical protein